MPDAVELGAAVCDGDDGDGDDGDAAELPPAPAGALFVGRTADGPIPALEVLGAGLEDVLPVGLLGGVEPGDPPDAGGLAGAL